MGFISQKFRANFFVKMLGFIKIPLMYFCRPKILYIDDDKVVVKISLRRRTKNHVGSMYFGALAVGADITGGYLALHHTNKINKRINLLFYDFFRKKDLFFIEKRKNFNKFAALVGYRSLYDKLKADIAQLARAADL